MSNRRDDEAYGRPDRNGVIAAWALIALAILVGVFVLSKLGGDDTSASPSSEATAVADDTALVAADPTAVTTPTSIVAPPAARVPSSIRVIVTNGSGVNKAAKRVSDALGLQQYQMQPPRDATAANFADAVFFAPGFDAEAQAIALALGQVDAIQADGSVIQQLPTIAAIPDVSTIKAPPVVPPFDIQVMVGPGLAKRFQTAPAAA